MFEKFLYSNMGPPKSGYNQLLQKPQTKLVQILDEDNFVSDFKSGSQRVKDFMSYHKFVELVELVTVVGPEGQKKRSFKFPLTACEMLCSDNSKIQQYFLPASGVVNLEEKVTRSVQKLVEVELDDDGNDDEDQTEEKEGQAESSQKSGENAANVQEKEGAKKEQGAKADAQGEQQFGQFVQAPPKPKKKVMVKEVVETTEIVTKQQAPLIDKLLNYFSSEINHTLTGYVCKILLNFTNKKSPAIFTKLFENPLITDNIFDHVFTHIGSRSTVEWLTRIFTIENRNFVAQRYELMVKFLKLMRNAEGVENLSNFAATVCQSFDKVTAHFKTATPVKELEIYNQKIPELLRILIDTVLSDREEVATYGVQVFGHLLPIFPIKDELNQFPELLTHYLPGTINKMKGILGQERTKLGLLPVKVLETYNSALRSTSVHEWFKNSQNNVFPILFGLVKKYAFNNIFHNEVFKFLQSCLVSEVTELSSFVIAESGLLQWLEEEANSETARLKGPKKGYAAHIVNLCKFLKEQAKKNANIQGLVKSPSFDNVWNVLVDKEIVSSQKLLGGFAKKEMQHKIMYSKQGILAAHATFLASTPAPVTEKDLNDPLQNEQLLQQLQRQLDGVDLAPEPKPAEVIVQQQHKAELIEQNQQHKAAFWKVHLDYDIDNLMYQVL